MPAADPRSSLVRAAQNLVAARQEWEAALLEAKTTAGMVQQARDVGDPAQMIDADQVLANHAASAVTPAEAQYHRTPRLRAITRGKPRSVAWVGGAWLPSGVLAWPEGGRQGAGISDA